VDSTTGDTIISGDLDVIQNSTLSGDVTIVGGSDELFTITDGSSTTFQVNSTTGDTTITGGALNVTAGLASLDGGINVNDAFTVATNGATVVSSTLDVTGTVELDSTLGVDGNVRIGATGASTATINATTGNIVTSGTVNGLDITGGASSVLDIAANRTVDINGNLTVDGNGVTINTGASAVSVVFNDNLTVNTLTNGHVLYSSADNTISSEATLSVSRGGTGTDGSSLIQNQVLASPASTTGPAAFRSLVNADLPNSGVPSGVYSAVEVNEKGIVTGGGQFIEIGTNGQTAPNPAFGLVDGGLFFMEIV
jgi:hypothetical protein